MKGTNGTRANQCELSLPILVKTDVSFLFPVMVTDTSGGHFAWYPWSWQLQSSSQGHSSPSIPVNEKHVTVDKSLVI